MAGDCGPWRGNLPVESCGEAQGKSADEVVSLLVCVRRSANEGLPSGVRSGFPNPRVKALPTMGARRLNSETNAATSPWPLRVYPDLPINAPAIPQDNTPGWHRFKGAEFRRRMLHILPGFFPFLLWAIPHKDPWGPILANSVIAITALIVINGLVRFSAFARPGEANGRASILGYAFPVLTTMSLCRGCEELGVMTLAILAFGDGSATVGGLLFGGKPLPWNPRKTLTGLLCFWGVGGILATVIYWGEARPGVSWAIAASVAGTAVLIAGLLESLPSRINDNLRVGFAAAIVGSVMHFALVG